MAMCNAPWYRRLTPVPQALVTIVIALLLQALIMTVPTGQHLYMSLQLLIIAYPVLADDLAAPHYVLRWLVIFGFWWVNHPWLDPTALAVGTLLALTAAVVYPIRNTVHYRWWANTIFALWLCCLFWYHMPGTTIAIQVRYSLMYLVMNAYAFITWSHDQREAQAKEALAAKVNYDTLTNAGSLSKFRADANQEFADAQQHHAPMTILAMDIDNFKNVNDTFGHPAGDAALIHMAALLEDFLQDVDANYRLYRTGGEEFAVLLPGQTTDEFLPTAQQCLETVRRAHFDYHGRSNRLTVSMGMTEWHPGDQSVNDIIQRADHNLYLSKQRGRDCITMNDQTPETSHLREVTLTYAFYTQPIVNINTADVFASELRLRTYDDGEWRRADDFNVGASTLTHILMHVAEQLSVHRLNGDFSLAELQTTAIHDGLIEFNRDANVTFTIELTAIPDQATFLQVARDYRQYGIHIALANTGWDISYADACAVIDQVDMVKFTMDQPGPDGYSPTQFAKISEWRNLAESHHLPFVMHGIDSDRDLKLARTMGIKYGQGYYFSRSVLPRIV
ncbi:GGDEF domain-containing protein [Lacticaseibacillus thailandensis]|nr:diguanylate cyclase [Lacticaseibacillus thailandensis]